MSNFLYWIFVYISGKIKDSTIITVFCCYETKYIATLDKFFIFAKMSICITKKLLMHLNLKQQTKLTKQEPKANITVLKKSL